MCRTARFVFQELYPKVVYGRIDSGGSGLIDSIVILLYSVFKWNPLNDLGEVIEAPQSLPISFGTLCEFEQHAECAIAAQAAPGSAGPVTDGREGRLDGVGGTDTRPMPGRE